MKLSTSAFLLTDEWQDRGSAHQLCFYARSSEHGVLELIFDQSLPVFFALRKAKLPHLTGLVDRKEVALKNFAGESVDALYFRTQRELRESREILSQNLIATFEADIDPCARFLMERFIRGQVFVEGEAEEVSGMLRMRNPKIKPCEVEPDFVIASIDIETGVKNTELYSIAVHMYGGGREEKCVFMRGEQDTDLSTLHMLKSEKQLLQVFLQWFQQADPDIIIGWHVIGFDLQFLESKCQEHKIEFALGRSKRSIVLRGGDGRGYFAYVPGRIVLDGPSTLRASFYSFEDFRLETVAQELLGKGKLISPEENKVASIEHLFAEDKEALARYNLEDCELVSQIFEKTGLIDLCIKRTQISGLLIDKMGRSAAAFDYVYLPLLHRRGYVASNVDDVRRGEHAAGGHVFEPEAGLYERVVVLDFKSLYPSIIRTFNIDPLARIEAGDKAIQTPQGYRFSSDSCILADYISELMERREDARRSEDAHLSQAIKILMNSFYGVMGSYGCRFYHPTLPRAITGTGQWLLKGSKEFLEKEGLHVIYGDTDSLFVVLGEGSSDSDERQGQALADQLTSYWKATLRQDFHVESRLSMEYEKAYLKFILPLARTGEGGAKKRYAGLLSRDGEEYVDFVGMESVRSDWTKLAKDFQAELYMRVFHAKEIKVWLREYIRRVHAGDFDESLVYGKRLRKKVEEYTKNVPPHVKAARLLKNPGTRIRYLITKRGPVPVELPHDDLDYEHYVDKQLRPIADSVLSLVGQSFDDMLQTQLSLF